MPDLPFIERQREARARLWGAAIQKNPPAKVVVKREPRFIIRDWLFISSDAAASRVVPLMPIDVGHKILSEVCKKHNVQHHELLGRRRLLHLVEARSEAYARLVVETNWSMMRIADFVGRDHSTLCKVLSKHHPQALRSVA